MFNQLVALGWGVVTFAIVIGVGTTLMDKFGSAVATCEATIGGGVATYNITDGYCHNASGTAGSRGGQAAQSTFYLGGQLGQNGLAGWTPAIIAFAVGLLFLGAFMIGKGGNTRQY